MILNYTKFNYYNILIKDSEYLDNSFIKVFDNIKDNFHKINEEPSTFPLSLYHGDLKSPNIFYKENKEPYFLDFQYINLNKGISDIIFLLIESVDFDEDLYINIITSNGISYNYNDYKKDLKNSLSLFQFVIAVWFNTEDKNNLTDKNFPLNLMNSSILYYHLNIIDFIFLLFILLFI